MTLEILLVEDDTVDAAVIMRGARQLAVDITHVTDATSALENLGQRDAHAGLIIVVDLSLPGLEGLELLRQIKNHPTYGTIPVIVLTTSGASGDIKAAGRLGASGFFTKALDTAESHEMFATIVRYWTLSRFP